MKKFISILLVAAMLACMVPAFMLTATASEAVNYGLNATLWQLKGSETAENFNPSRFSDIIGSDGRSALCGYTDYTQRYDESISQLLKISKVYAAETSDTVVSEIGTFANDGYMSKWTGTVTATESGTYYLVGCKIDNGFVAFVDQDSNGALEADEKFYEYWASEHWFDGSSDRLLTNLGGFTLEAGVPTAVELWYLEMDGGEALDIRVSTNSDGSSEKTFSEAGLTFTLTKTTYISNNVINNDRVNAVLPEGVSGGACADTNHDHTTNGNCSSASDTNNHKYADTIDAIKNEMMNLGTIQLPTFESSAFTSGLNKYGWLAEDSLIEYEGYLTPVISGKYEFGTSQVDNCLYVAIETSEGVWTTLYEFWAGKVWNDATTTYSGVEAELEAGKSYKLKVAYLEVDGGQCITMKVKLNGAERSLSDTGLVLTTEAFTESFSENIVPSSSDWYYTTSGEDNRAQIRSGAWAVDSSVYSTWQTGTAPLADEWGTNASGSSNQSIWAVKEFNVDDLSAFSGYALAADILWDDNIKVYINGNLVFVNRDSNSGTVKYLTDDASSLLKVGTNTIAVKLVQGWDGADFDLGLYKTKEAVSAPEANSYVNISTADELISYFDGLNSLEGDVTVGHNVIVNITADLDMSEKNYTPLTKKFVGTICGNGHTISNINYTVDSAETDSRIGLIAYRLSNSGVTGKLTDLVLENCTLTVNIAEGATGVYAGLAVGEADRGCIENVAVKSSTLTSTGEGAGGIVGVVNWDYDNKGVHAENCEISSSTVKAVTYVGGIVAWLRWNNTATLGDVKVAYTTLDAQNTSLTCARVDSTLSVGNITERKEVSSKVNGTPTDGSFYYQTRTNSDGTVDYRVLMVADKDLLMARDSIEVTVKFTSETNTTDKTFSFTPETVFTSVYTDSDNHRTCYDVADGDVLFGYVIKNVPSDYVISGGYTEAGE